MFQEAHMFSYGFYLFTEYLVGKEKPIKRQYLFDLWDQEISGVLLFSGSSVQGSKH